MSAGQHGKRPLAEQKPNNRVVNVPSKDYIAHEPHARINPQAATPITAAAAPVACTVHAAC